MSARWCGPSPMRNRCTVRLRRTIGYRDRRESASMTAVAVEIDVVEAWRGCEWSRITHSVVAVRPNHSIVTHEHRGSVGAFASGRGMAGYETLTCSERKLRALETLQVCTLQVPAPLDTLFFWQRDRYVRINRGWDSGEFLGWYVDFIRPPCVRRGEIVTMDLVLDALVSPEGAWTWKDRDDFDEAQRRGLVIESEAVAVWGKQREFSRTLSNDAELSRRAGTPGARHDDRPPEGRRVTRSACRSVERAEWIWSSHGS